MRNIKMPRLFSLLLLFMGLLTNSDSAEAQGWKRALPSTVQADGEEYILQNVTSFVNDTAYAITTNSVTNQAGLFRVRGDGGDLVSSSLNPIGETNKIFKALLREPNGRFVYLREHKQANGKRRLLLAGTQDNDGVPPHASGYWEEPITFMSNINFTGTEIYATSEGNYIVLGARTLTAANSIRDVLLMKITPTGEVLWMQTYETENDDWGVKLQPTSDNGFLILKNQRLATDTLIKYTGLLKVDALGNLQSETNLSGSNVEEGFDLSATNDGNYLVSGTNFTTENANVFIIKVEENSTILWRQDYVTPNQQTSGRAVVQDENNSILIAGGVFNELTGEQKFSLMKTTAVGEPVWKKTYDHVYVETGEAQALSLTPDGGYLLTGIGVHPDGLDLTFWVKTDTNGIVKPCEIWGNIFHDTSENCLQDDDELGLSSWTVRAYQDDETIFYGTTDEFGNYQIPVDVGNYEVSVLLPNEYWMPCHNDSMIHLDYLDTVQIDFPIKTMVECPVLSVDVGHYLSFRPCEETDYVINYCNLGPIIAEDAYVEITLDPLFVYNSASIEPSLIDENVYTFSLGDIASGVCDDFTINVTPNCDSTELSMTLCVEAHIFPDSICLPEFVNWPGAFIELGAECDEENLTFNVRNTGESATTLPLDYVIIEDAILLMQGEVEVGAGQTKPLPVPANGSTYHLYVNQEPGAPSFGMPMIAIEGCGTNEDGEFSTGFFNQFPNDDDESYLSSLCLTLVGPYDPNSKEALPTGYGEEHTIWQNIDLDYTIHFQNIGTDTAFRVVIIDTLSQFLDQETVIPGAASHDYDFSISNAEGGSQAVLVFTFNGINLVDSLTNEQGSQGFVNFKIAQKRDNPIGTLIENEAGIYFDFNLPIITNRVWHTVGEHLFDVVNGTQQIFIDEVEIKAYPNPFSERLTIEIQGLANQNSQLNLYDSNGRRVKQLAFENGKVEISAKGLTTGFYFYQIISKTQLVGSGKLILK